MQRIEFTNDKRHQHVGMGDLLLISPDGRYEIQLMYVGEPPHGDSFHSGFIDGHPYPGFIWGCMFAFSSCSRYFAFSAMPTKYERRTAIVDLDTQSYFVLPQYIYQFRFDWPVIVGDGSISSGISYSFDGLETWNKL